MHWYPHVCTRDTHTTPQSCASAPQHHRGRLHARRPLLHGATSASLRQSSRAPRVVVEEWCQSALLHLRHTRRPSPRRHRRARPTPAASSIAFFPFCDAAHAPRALGHVCVAPSSFFGATSSGCVSDRPNPSDANMVCVNEIPYLSTSQMDLHIHEPTAM